METGQMNIRVPVDLMNDLDVVSRLLKVNKSEWIKTRLAEDVQKEKARLLMQLGELYVKGMITKKEVESQVGKDIADRMESTYLTAMQSVDAGKRYGRRLRS